MNNRDLLINIICYTAAAIIIITILLGISSIFRPTNQTDVHSNNIKAEYNVYYEYDVYNNDTIPVDTIYKEIK
jgi:hypothetical protein